MTTRTNSAKWTGTRWRIDVQKDGQRKSFYSSKPGRTGQREANAKADKWLETGVAPTSMRVEEAYALWYATQQQTTGEGNCRNISTRWRTWIGPGIGHKKLSSLTEQDLQNIVNKAYAAGLSKKTLACICADMRALCKFCRASKLSAFNPEGLRIPAGARLKGKKILQPTDLLTLFNVDTTLYKGKTVHDDYINAYRFQVLTGLRPGELIGLQWGDIHGKTVQVQRAVNVRGEVTRGKNENAVRAVVLSDMARRVLDAQYEITGDMDSVFCILSEQQYARYWRRYCEANGLTVVAPYELRHTFVSVVKTLPVGEVKSLVGHSQDMDTFGVYGHALTGDAEATAEAVNGTFLKILNNA